MRDAPRLAARRRHHVHVRIAVVVSAEGEPRPVRRKPRERFRPARRAQPHRRAAGLRRDPDIARIHKRDLRLGNRRHLHHPRVDAGGRIVGEQRGGESAGEEAGGELHGLFVERGSRNSRGGPQLLPEPARCAAKKWRARVPFRGVSADPDTPGYRPARWRPAQRRCASGHAGGDAVAGRHGCREMRCRALLPLQRFEIGQQVRQISAGVKAFSKPSGIIDLLALAALGDVAFLDRHGLAGDVAHVERVAAFAGDEAFDLPAFFRFEPLRSRSPARASRSA